MRYPTAYHAAHRHIVAFGGHRYAAQGRQLVAAALRALRAMYRAGELTRASLEWERAHFHYVGHPCKGTN